MRIKRVLKITSKIAAILVLLFIILVLLLSIPSIQTRLGKYATKKINEDFGTNINIERVGLQFNGDVELKGIYVEDHRKDTLISITELNTSIISFRKLYKGKLTFGDIDIEELYFNLKTYKDERITNLDQFIEKFGTPKEKPKEKFLLSSSDMTVTQSRFRLTDENKSTSDVLDFKNLNFNITDFLVFGADVSTRINKLSFDEHRGVALKNLKTNFLYTIRDMTFDDLDIETEFSSLEGDLKFEYDLKDLPHFVDSVNVTANFDKSNIALKEVNKFYNQLGPNVYAKLKGDFTGTLNDLKADNVVLTASRQTLIDGNLNFKNIFGKKAFKMEGFYNNLSSSSADLRTILPKILKDALPSSLDSLGRFTIKGASTVTSNTLKGKISIDSRLGKVISDLEIKDFDDIDNATYKGNVVLDTFNLGSFMKNPDLGMASVNMDINGKSFLLANLNTFVSGDIASLVYNNYNYKDASVSGNIQDKVFNGELISRDDNLQLKFNGLIDFSNTINNYDFTANVTKADLNALNFVDRDSISVFSGILTMDMKATNLDDAVGDIQFKNTLYKNQNGEYYFKDFAISSVFREDIRFIEVNSPDIIEGNLNGKFAFKDVMKLVENSLGNIYANYQPHDIDGNQVIDFNFKVYNKIAEVFLPSLKLGSNTFFRGHIESNSNEFDLTFRSPQIALDDNFAKDIELRLDNDNPLFNTYIEIDSLNSKYYNASKFSLINLTVKDTLFIKTEFKGGEQNRDNFDLNLYYTINDKNESVVGFKKSDVRFKDYDWYINEKNNNSNKIQFDRGFKNVSFDDINISHLSENMLLSGIIRDSTYKDIDVDFKDVNLEKITPRIDSLALAGNVNGKLNFKQEGDIYLPESNITVDNFEINKFNLGSFRANIVGYESLSNYDVNISLKDDQRESLSVIGNLDFSNNNSTIDLEVNFDEFILNPLTPFGSGVITNIRGEVEGNVRVVGRLNRPDIIGELDLDKGGLSIPYLNVDYGFQDNTIVNLKDQSFNFNNAQLTDSEYASNAGLTGSISHVNFSKWALDFNLNSDRLLVLNTTDDNDDALYYGTAFVGGDINVKGPTDQLVIQASVETETGTIFKIPLNDTETFDSNSFIYFLTREEKEARQKGEEFVINNTSGLELDFDLDVNQNAEIEIVIDKDSGSSIRGRGDGGLLTQINTNGKFNMYGDFIVNTGTYNFIYGGLIQKEFTVQQGGTLVWEGDPLRAEMNIIAVHSGINANPSILLDNPINQSIPVEVQVQLSGQLEQPDVNFDLNFPNVNSILDSELQYRLSDNDTKQFQALSLLATETFRNDLSNFSSGDAFGVFSDRIKAVLNNLLSNGDGSLVVGVDYQVGENTPEFQSDDRFIASFSTKLSDRILINGNVGVPIGGVSETVIAGNVEIQVLINKDRTLTLKFFNRENQIVSFGEQIGYTQGIGVSYNVEFDNLKELFSKIFKRKKDKPKDKVLTSKEEVFPDYIGFKQKDDSKNKKN